MTRWYRFDENDMPILYVEQLELWPKMFRDERIFLREEPPVEHAQEHHGVEPDSDDLWVLEHAVPPVR